MYEFEINGQVYQIDAASEEEALAKAQALQGGQPPPDAGSQPEGGVDFLQLPGINQLWRASAGMQDLMVEPVLAHSKAFGTPEEQQRALEYEKRREEGLSTLDSDGGVDWWRLGGSMAVPGGGATKTAGFVGRVAENLGLGAVMGAGGPAGPTSEEAANMTPEEIQAATRKDMAFNTGVGGLAGALPPEAIRAVANLGGGAVRYFQDLISAADREGASAVEYAKRYLLDIMPDDVSRNKLSKTVGQYLDMLDPASSRQKQIDKARSHVEEIHNRNIMDPNEDPQNIIQRSMTDRDQVLRAQDKLNYESVYAKTDTLPTGEPRFVQDDSIRNVAESMFYDLQHGIPEIQGTKLESIAARLADGEHKTFRQWDGIRSDLYNQADIRRMSGDHKSAGILEAMSNRITGELDRTANDIGGDVLSSWKKARNFHKDQVIPNRQGAIGRAVMQKDAEAFVAELIGSSPVRERNARAHQLWNALDADGRKAAKQVLMEEVVRLGTDKAQDTGFSPAKAATAIENMQNRFKTFFNEDDAAQMTGLANYLRFISRSTLAAGTSGTGMSLGAGVLGGIGYGATQGEEGGATGPIAAGVGTYFLMRSPKGRKILQKMANTDPDTKAFQNLTEAMDDVFAQAGFSSAVASSRLDTSGGGW